MTFSWVEDRTPESIQEPPQLSSEKPGFLSALLEAFVMIFISEIGDKTFLIAVILAMKYSRMSVFLGASVALVLMTFISTYFGEWLEGHASKSVIRYLSIIVFIIFGLLMLFEGLRMKHDEHKDRVRKTHTEMSRMSSFRLLPGEDDEEDNHRRLLHGRVFLAALGSTFLGEWGDRTQISTFILASRANLHGVLLGACLGHISCTGLAVLGGELLGTRLSVRTITIAGGICFLAFALFMLIIEPFIPDFKFSKSERRWYWVSKG